MCDIQNNSGQDMAALTNMAKQFYPYAQEYLGFDKPASIVYESDPNNAQNPLGKTAQYNPSNYTVTLFVDGRHPKDLLRSLAHELVHHTQNCRGDLTAEKLGEMGDGYAQTDGHLRKMEQEAYASMVMRDWEDQYKSKRRNNLHETNYINKEIYTMSEHEQLIKRIVAEVMKNVKVTTENKEDEEVQEEGSGDRKDPRDNNQTGRQGEGHDGSPGQFQEAQDDEDAEVQEEGFEKPKSATGSGPTAKAGKQDRTDVANQVPSGFVNENEDGEEDELDEAAKGSRLGGDRAKQQCEKQGKKMVAGKCVEMDEGKEEEGETIEESEDDDSPDDLQETFRRRNALLFEKLVKWSKV